MAGTVSRPKVKAVARGTRLAREAIAHFVELNVPRFNGWLQQVAEGIPQYDHEGQIIKNANGSILWLVRPDPATAMKLVADVCEYHLPKLARTEVDVVDRSAMPLEQLSTAELQRRLYVQLGLVAEDAVEVVQQSLSADPTSAE